MLSSNYLMYLRKSRADDPSETVEEVLARQYSRYSLPLFNSSLSIFIS